MDTSDPMYCGEERLLTMENAEKYFKLKDDLRKLRDEMAEVEGVNKSSLYPALSEEECLARTRGQEAAFWKGKIEKLIGDKDAVDTSE